MSEYIVALSVDKVQTFLTEIIHSHVQEKEAEEATLRGIINSSDQISIDFFESIYDQFPEAKKNVLMKCSGVFIFRSYQPKEKLEEGLNNIFVQYYQESCGQKLLRWVCFPSEDMENIAAIQKAKKELKKTKNLNRIIEKNKAMLFSFQNMEDNKKNDRKRDAFPAFAENINALRLDDENGGVRFRIAVIKADLDGMGGMFREINNENEYTKISDILNREISLDGLHRVACECGPGDRQGWIFPLYIAGDDIFFAVAIADMIRGINVCQKLMQTVNSKMEENGIKEKRLGVSVGVEITFNKEPVRYYMERVENQLKTAKAYDVPTELGKYHIMKISVGNQVFFNIMNYSEMKKDQNNENGKRRKASALQQQLQNVPIWNHFIYDIKFLNYIRNTEGECGRLLGRPNFFYSLIEDITDETVRQNDVRYINHILYHLEPKYLEHPDHRLREAELVLNYNLIRQLYYRDENGFKILGEKEQKNKAKKRFETYLRLMLLFTDVRFRIFPDQTEDIHAVYKEKKDIKKLLFSKPRKYLFDHCLSGKTRDLTKFFVRKVTLPKMHKEGYQKITLERSAFFRLRKADNVDVAAEIIELHNPTTEEEKAKIEAHNEQRRQEGKLPNRLYFEKDRMKNAARKREGWTSDYVDSLMLFFSYNDMFMKFKK